jgi:Ino eighty subunit 2
MSGRTRRAAAAPANNPLSSSVTVSRSNTPEERRRSIKLTVKLPSSKLREVVTERDVKGVKAFNTEGKYWANKPEGHLRKRTPKSYKIPDPSDDEEEEDDDETGEDEVDELMNDVDEAGAETEGSEEEDAEGDAEEDIEMDEPTLPPPPKIKLRHTATSDGRPSKPMLVVTPAETGPLRSVEQKEADVDPGDEDEADEDDEEEDLSELNSEDEEQQDETNLEEDGDGEGDGEDEEDVNGADELDDDEGDLDLDSERMTPGSGAVTPDLAKMTKRQRREDEGFMALDMAPQV